MSSILLLQSDPAATERTRRALAAVPEWEIAGTAATLAQADAAIAARPFDLLLCDLRFDDGPVTELLDRLAPALASRMAAVVIAPSARDPMLREAFRHGAAGYLVAGHADAALVQTVRQVLDGESLMSPDQAGDVKAFFDAQAFDNTDFVGESQNPMHLSDQERQLLDWIIAGRPMAEIAHDLYSTPHLIGVQLRGLYRRMQFAVRADTLTLELL
jgi:DNA-binding NarL/FixJ family response regulator